MTHLSRWLTRIGAAAIVMAAVAVAPARAQTEMVPKAGKGHVVVVLSGLRGAAAFESLAWNIESLGYYVVEFDGNRFGRGHGAELHDAIVKVQQSEHALPGKVAVVGFSLGGGVALAWATRWPEIVATVVAWYPATRFIKDPDDFVSRIQVPALILTGGDDDNYGAGPTGPSTWIETADEWKTAACCWVERARGAAAAAAARNLPLELVVYPGVGHDFVRVDQSTYDGPAANDGWRRQAIRLKQAFGD
jgi:dienelactone hydrolase